MDSNIIIIIIGGIIILLTLIILIKSGKKEEEDFNSEALLTLSSVTAKSPQNTLNHLAIMEGIETLKLEMTDIKSELERLVVLLETPSHQGESNIASLNLNNWENFDQSLNYNMFLQKNQDILILHKEGKSLEEIARSLNKSIREIEMVIKLLK